MPEELPNLPTDAEITERLAAAGERAKAEINAAEAEHQADLEKINARLDEIGSKISEVTHSGAPDLPNIDEAIARAKANRPGGIDRDKGNTYLGMGIGITVAYSIVGSTLAGLGIGKLIQLQTKNDLPLAFGTLFGAVIGLASGIFIIIRAQQKQDADDKRNKRS